MSIYMRNTYKLIEDSACHFDNRRPSCKRLALIAKTVKASREVVMEMTSYVFVYARQILMISSTAQHTELPRYMCEPKGRNH